MGKALQRNIERLNVDHIDRAIITVALSGCHGSIARLVEIVGLQLFTCPARQAARQRLSWSTGRKLGRLVFQTPK